MRKDIKDTHKSTEITLIAILKKVGFILTD